LLFGRNCPGLGFRLGKVANSVAHRWIQKTDQDRIYKAVYSGTPNANPVKSDVDFITFVIAYLTVASASVISLLPIRSTHTPTRSSDLISVAGARTRFAE
jgi:hypothetical protein